MPPRPKVGYNLASYMTLEVNPNGVVLRHAALGCGSVIVSQTNSVESQLTSIRDHEKEMHSHES